MANKPEFPKSAFAESPYAPFTVNNASEYASQASAFAYMAVPALFHTIAENGTFTEPLQNNGLAFMEDILFHLAESVQTMREREVSYHAGTKTETAHGGDLSENVSKLFQTVRNEGATR